MARLITEDKVKGGFMVIPYWLDDLSISIAAKWLYAKALRRLRLSISKGWKDEDGNPFCYYRRDEMARDLDTSLRSVDRYISELKDLGLVLIIQGYGQKPSRIYLFELEEEEKADAKETGEKKVARQKSHAKYDAPQEEPRQKRQSGTPKKTKWHVTSGEQSYIERVISSNYKPRVRARGSADAVPLELVDNFREPSRGGTEEEEDRIEEDDVRTNKNTKTPIVEDGRVKKMIDKRRQKGFYSEHERALQKIKRIVTAKDRAELAAMIEAHGGDRVLSALETVRSRGTRIASTSYIRTMLKEDTSSSPWKRKPIDYATWGRAGNLGIQPVETRYTPEEMQAIIERKIAESRTETYA